VKRVLGLKSDDQILEQELKHYLAYEIETNPGAAASIRVNYNESDVTLAPEQIVCMILKHLIHIASTANSGGAVADVVVSVPVFWNAAQRVAMLDAMRVANINCLRLLHEHTAVALQYGIYKYSSKKDAKDKLDTVLFVDMGHSAFTASVVSFRSGELKVVGVGYDDSLGGRDFDRLLAKHLASLFKERTSINLGDGLGGGKNQKAWVKLLQSAEKCKKSLSPLGIKEGRISCECLAEDTDLDATVPLKTFEDLVESLLDRISAPINEALVQAGIGKGGELHSVEIVGGGTRVRCVKERICLALKEYGVAYGSQDPDDKLNPTNLSTTLNADECVARGCALQCAILSSSFKV
jgi:molecular chaperone DnaK (HSP70)